MGCVVFIKARIPGIVLTRVVVSAPLYVGSSSHELGVPRSDGTVQLSAVGCHLADAYVIRHVRANVSDSNSLPRARALRVHSVDDNTLPFGRTPTP